MYNNAIGLSLEPTLSAKWHLINVDKWTCVFIGVFLRIHFHRDRRGCLWSCLVDWWPPWPVLTSSSSTALSTKQGEWPERNRTFIKLCDNNYGGINKWRHSPLFVWCRLWMIPIPYPHKFKKKMKEIDGKFPLINSEKNMLWKYKHKSEKALRNKLKNTKSK